MLQRTPYMTAEALGIDPNEHQALIAVLGKLERGELHHAPMLEETIDKFGDACGFNMADWSCGTVMCIGGWVDKIMGYRRDDFPLPETLFGLYYPQVPEKRLQMHWYRQITPDQSAQALRNYLTHGEARWAEVLAP